jgi:hypothetical protein
MPARVDDFNKKFVYTETNPEGIIAAKKDALFYRRNKEFFVNLDGNLEVGPWQKLPYRTVIIPPPPLTKLINYKQPHEIWIKTTDGFIDEEGKIMPKTGWKLYAYKDAFSMLVYRKLKWIFPPPISSYDPIGVNGNRSYDENYYYVKTAGIWYRTPITTWTTDDNFLTPDDPNLTNNLPFVDLPRAPVVAGAELGEQNYDKSFFYIKVNASTWKRSRLSIYTTPDKMAVF